MLHQNNGYCPYCDVLFDKYPGFYIPLKLWFQNFQANHPEAHISCAGRGKIEQQLAFANGRSRAKWGESAHNYNCAIDIFCQGDKSLYDPVWFNTVLAPELEDWMTWYGKPGSPYFELPHVQVFRWRGLLASGILKLVEE